MEKLMKLMKKWLIHQEDGIKLKKKVGEAKRE